MYTAVHVSAFGVGVKIVRHRLILLPYLNSTRLRNFLSFVFYWTLPKCCFIFLTPIRTAAGQHPTEEPIIVYFGTTLVAVAEVEDLGETAERLKTVSQEEDIAKASN